MARRILKGIAAAVLLLVLVVGAGAVWLVQTLHTHMTPPPDPPGQPSIALGAEPLAPASPPLSLPFDRRPAFAWPDLAGVPAAARPWTRWWWPGGDVELPALRAQLDALHAAGFGGVEIQPFLSGMINVADNEALMERVYSFDSPGYYTTLNAAIEYAHSLGMQVDLTNFSGWPPGGPQINLEDSPTIMAYGQATVSGGDTVELDLPRPHPGAAQYLFGLLEFAGADFMNFPAEHARLLSVVAARAEGGQRSRNPLNLADTLNLDPDSLIVLTAKVADGRLRWEAPPGDWTVVASYLLPSGEVPMGAAQKPQGFVVDHLREAQVLGQYAYAFGEASGLPRQFGRGMRGIFNDSLEFRLRRMAAPDILEEFRARRGYDLEPWLPALYVEGIDNVYFREIMGLNAAPEFRLSALDERIRHDYQQTLSDLVIERFVETSARWAQSRSLESRGQSYGMDLDLLRGLGANTIPETEQLWAGGANVGLKFASSAAALYDRTLVSAESFVWINRDYMPAARRIKAAADKLFLAGINHIVYHGTPYRWAGSGAGEFPDVGWQPFSGPQNPAHFSGHFASANTALWPDMPDLNTYIARSQALLREGAPVVDVLVYYPFLGFHGPNRPDNGDEVLVNGSLPDADPQQVPLEAGALVAGKKIMDRFIKTHAHDDPRVTWMNTVQPLLHELEQRGITWAWVNDHALQQRQASGGRLGTRGGVYSALLFPSIESLDVHTLPALQAELAQGVPVVFAGALPDRQRSFHNAQDGDRAVSAGVAKLLATGAEHVPLDSDALLSRLEAIASPALRPLGKGTIHRHQRLLSDGGAIVLYANQSPESASTTIAVADDRPLWWYDAMTGRAWPAEPVDGRLALTLDGFSSRFLVVGEPLPDALAGPVPATVAAAAGERLEHLADWTVSFDGNDVSMASSTDWRDVEALRFAHGPVVYRHTLTLATVDAGQRYLLDLGLVQGSAQVRVNGHAVGRASLPPFTLDIGAALRSGDNRIEVEVLAPLRNHAVGRALSGDVLYENMLAFADQTVAAGLMGPVVLYRAPAAPAGSDAL